MASVISLNDWIPVWMESEIERLSEIPVPLRAIKLTGPIVKVWRIFLQTGSSARDFGKITRMPYLTLKPLDPLR